MKCGPQISMQRGIEYGTVQALLDTKDEGACHSPRASLPWYGNFGSSSGHTDDHLRCVLGSLCAAKYLKHTSEVDMFSRT